VEICRAAGDFQAAEGTVENAAWGVFHGFLGGVISTAFSRTRPEKKHSPANGQMSAVSQQFGLVLLHLTSEFGVGARLGLGLQLLQTVRGE
jgi:hypothetical protein